MTLVCADCGRIQRIPALPPRSRAVCARCGRLLARRTLTGSNLTLVCAAALLLLLPPSAALPLMGSTIRNLVFGESRLISSVGVIYNEVWFPFAFGFLFFAFLIPWCRAALQVLVLGSLLLRVHLPQRGRLFRWSQELRIWSMTDLVVIAGVIAYFRAAASAEVEVRLGAWMYAAVATVAFIGDRALDRRAVWSAIRPDPEFVPGRHVASCDFCETLVPERRPGDRCPRCGNKLDRELATRFAPALGAVAAVLPLTLPAYSAAIMVNDQLTGVLEHTIVGTVQMLADRGYWQFGVVILFTGIVVPMTVLVGMVWLLAATRFPARRMLVVRTHLHRLLSRAVRWPMVLPFIAAITAPIVNFRGIDDIVAGPGSTPLFIVIVLLMAAVRLFHPRLMWMTAGVQA